MKLRFFPALVLAMQFIPALAADAAGNKYDTLAKTLTPLTRLFSPAAPDRAARLTLELEVLTGAPAGLAGARVDLAIQPPDRLKITATVNEEELIFCRDRQRVWAAPAQKIEEVFAWFAPLPEPKPGFALGHFSLPFPPEQLALLPVLFVVQERTGETVEGIDCRVLDLKLLPEIAGKLRVKDWTARLWVTPDDKPSRVRIWRPGWEISVRVKDVEYLQSIPDEDWRPSAGETDVLFFNAARMSQLMQLIERELTGTGSTAR